MFCQFVFKQPAATSQIQKARSLKTLLTPLIYVAYHEVLLEHNVIHQ